MARTLRVTETAAVFCDYFYDIEVPEDLPDDEAKQFAIGIVRSGEVHPYDSRHGEMVPWNVVYPDYEAELR